MIAIAHRGNLRGVVPDKENHPDYIDEAIAARYDVEIDVWCDTASSGFILGHDAPQYPIDVEFLKRRMKSLWCHAKDKVALQGLLNVGMHCFFHETDAMVLTSKQFIWTYPGQCAHNAIAVLPETASHYIPLDGCVGICSDVIEMYRVI